MPPRPGPCQRIVAAKQLGATTKRIASLNGKRLKTSGTRFRLRGEYIIHKDTKYRIADADSWYPAEVAKHQKAIVVLGDFVYVLKRGSLRAKRRCAAPRLPIQARQSPEGFDIAGWPSLYASPQPERGRACAAAARH